MDGKIARASAALTAAALLGAAAAAAQPLAGPDDGTQWLPAPGDRSEALNVQHGLGRPDGDPFMACRTVGAPTGLERFLCYRSAANLANELHNLPRPPTRPM
jgi:hypothetical protein